ncbi:MAG: hypothetical protein ACREF6_16165, partial [Alphaproteobacteria bacterium]
MRLLQSLLMLPVAAAAAFGAPAAGADTPPPERMRGGVRLLALAPDAGARFDVSVLPPEAALDRIAGALDLIRQRSPASAAAMDRLEAAGRVTLIYYPNEFRDRNRPNAQAVALFLPEFLKSRGLGAEGLDFTVVINQFGVKWPAEELAAVIVHELAGHGTQHLQGRIESGRVLDLECEASLYQEQAYQDLGAAKKARTVVLFRRQMEYRYCADFRAYMLKHAPGGLALWDSLNPDVATLLGLFADYRRVQAAQKDRAARPVSSRSR